MMMMSDKKRAVNAILGPREGEKPEEKSDTLDTLAGELIDAIKSDDASGVADALRACFAQCGSEGDDSGEG